MGVKRPSGGFFSTPSSPRGHSISLVLYVSQRWYRCWDVLWVPAFLLVLVLVIAVALLSSPKL